MSGVTLPPAGDEAPRPAGPSREAAATPLYDAFISYSHAKDKALASALQSAMQKLGKPWYRRRALRLFRDDTSLTATPHLWPSIEQALRQSRFLILMASPEAAASPWVDKEVTTWLACSGADTVLIALADGELAWDPEASDFRWSDATPLPPSLKRRFPDEPRWIDLRRYRGGASPRDARFTEFAADFAAALHGRPKEDLLSQEVRQQRRALRLAGSAVALLAVLFALALWQWTVARAERNRAQLNFTLLKTQVARNNSDLFAETLISIEAGDALIEKHPHSALMQYRGAVLIRQTLVKTDPGNLLWRSGLAVALDRVAHAEIQIGDAGAALSAASKALTILRQLYTAAPGAATKSELVGVLGDTSYVLLLDRRAQEALDRAEEALKLDPHAIVIQTNRVDALLFLGRFDEAKAIYLRYRDLRSTDSRTFAAHVRDDFSRFRSFGIEIPDRKRIEALLSQ